MIEGWNEGWATIDCPYCTWEHTEEDYGFMELQFIEWLGKKNNRVECQNPDCGERFEVKPEFSLIYYTRKPQ